MWVQHNLDNWHNPPDTPVGLTLGAFDGVHLGHQALIRWMVQGAHAAGSQAVVLTFEPVPRQFFHPREHTRLSSLEERLSYIQALDVDGVIVQTFDEKLMQRSASAFITALTQTLTLRGLWLGADTALGHGREGDVAFLQQAGQHHGFNVQIFEETVTCGGAPARSSRIRHALRAGYVHEAWACLGRPYQLCGTIVHGDKRGRTLGFPTANLDVAPERLHPANGVYITHAHLERGTFQAVTSVGTRPTFNHRPPTVEAYLLDFDAAIYGEPLRLEFLHHLRPEVKFSAADALIAQMHQDVVNARAWFAEGEPCPQGCALVGYDAH